MRISLKKYLVGIWNVPNVLTMIRLALIPVFVILYFNGLPKISLLVFLMASFTDFLDGHIARKYNLITAFGKLMDPLADKFMVCTALLCQAIAGIIPWIVFVLVAIKEIIMMVGSVYMLSKDVVVHSNLMGKTAQCAFIVALFLSFWHAEFVAIHFQIDRIILWVSIGCAICALIDYSVFALKTLKSLRSNQAGE